jgi:hypothetical protein
MIKKIAMLAMALVCCSTVQAQVPLSVYNKAKEITDLIAECAQAKTQLEMTMSGISQTANELENSHAAHVQQCPAYQGAFCYDWLGKKAARDEALAAANLEFFQARPGTYNSMESPAPFWKVPVYNPDFQQLSRYLATTNFGQVIVGLQTALGANPTPANIADWFTSANTALGILTNLKADLIARRESLRAGFLLPLYQDIVDEQACFNAFQQSGGCGGGGGGYHY